MKTPGIDIVWQPPRPPADIARRPLDSPLPSPEAMRTERGVSRGRLLDADPANEHRQRHLSSLAEHKHE
jgi:hypothetical protein